MLAFALIAPALVHAQEAEIAPLPRPNPERVGAGGPGSAIAAEAIPAPIIPPLAPLPLVATAGVPQDVVLTALLIEGGPAIAEGLHWRVFADGLGADGRLPLVAEVEGGIAHVPLLPGNYLLHAAYGRAGATARLVVDAQHREQTVVLNAGGLRLAAVLGEDIPIGVADLRFEVYTLAAEIGDRTMVADNALPNEVIRLNAGAYHVVSYYGGNNAIVRADIRVEAGTLTDVTLYHQAARVTLKLVTERGGEALANTAWSVVTAGGEILYNSIGAFPSVILQAGEYTAIAEHNGQIFQNQFVVETGLNRDVEVLAENPVAPVTAAAAAAAAAP